ncbi:aldo/keto reductase family protein [Kutzneria sp. NPDC051319]|uniref:aldo/keto reductase family protein n=1 Tax=Kutzneria sp. NPDC051319 TaxID=3155047 RepID=UPI003416EC6E
MEYQHLGNSGLVISRIAYGNSLTAGNQLDESAARSCVHAAVDLGVTTFDTADVYSEGRAEEVLGRALAGHRRSGAVICTKVYWPSGPGPNDRGLSRKHVLESAEASLRRLGTDYIDLYQAHRYDFQTPLEETMLAFADLVRAGKALYIGVSEWTAEQLGAAAELAGRLGVPLVSNQPQYSMLWRVIEDQVIPASRKLGIGQMVWSPVAGGVLTGKYLPGRPAPAGSRVTDAQGGAEGLRRSNLLDDEVLTRVQSLRPLAAQVGLSMAQLALAWVLRDDAVAAAVIGASSPEQLADNVKAVDVRLGSELLDRIDEVLAPVIVRDPALTQSPARRP